ncbi:MAG: DNA-3-methyladenine glycosylase, partial [Gemmatimonadetes bacterium]|nr:DNA-3-methyladenine glycosylase [Gemmatimonadota bacterium]
ITGSLDTHPLDREPLCIIAGARVADAAVMAGPRIGITRAVEWQLRFCERGSRWLSR